MLHNSLAQTPNEVAVLVNINSADSKHVANEFIALRGIPASNVIYLDLPADIQHARAQISPGPFSKTIWNPARKILQQRELSDHILAWVYSVDFPVRITRSEALSLQGATFFWNDLPSDDDTKNGRKFSRLFQGPVPGNEKRGAGGSLDRYHSEFGESYPTPSMMLGYTGARGNTTKNIIKNLRRGVAADHTTPSGTVYFVKNDDVRSRCREWEFSLAVSELERLGVSAEITDKFPAKASVIGLMTGSAWAHPWHGNTYLPGCMAETLTSAGAYFHAPEQTKLSSWMSAGITATAGTVIEPYAIWTKFPHARFFTFYAQGCTMLESFFQSVACPVQLLILGDPLARPYAPRISIVVTQHKQGKALVFNAKTTPSRISQWEFFLDGQRIETNPNQSELTLDNPSPGHHTLKVISKSPQPLNHWAAYSTNFVIASDDYGISTTGPIELDLHHPATFELNAKGTPRTIGLLHNNRVIAESKSRRALLTIDPSIPGLGPITLQPFAKYSDELLVYGIPLHVRVARLNKPPKLLAIRQEGIGKKAILYADTADTDEDAITCRWFERLLPAPDQQQKRITGGALSTKGKTMILTPTAEDRPALWLFEPGRKSPDVLRAKLAISPKQTTHLAKQFPAIVFNVRNENRFDYFGFHARSGAWVFGRYRDGKRETISQKGQPLATYNWQSLELRAAEDGLTAFVNGKATLDWPDNAFQKQPFGIATLGEPVSIRTLLVSPPHQGRLAKGTPCAWQPGTTNISHLAIELSDGYARSMTPVKITPQ